MVVQRLLKDKVADSARVKVADSDFECLILVSCKEKVG